MRRKSFFGLFTKSNKLRFVLLPSRVIAVLLIFLAASASAEEFRPLPKGFVNAGVGIWGLNGAAGLHLSKLFAAQLYYESDTSILRATVGEQQNEQITGVRILWSMAVSRLYSGVGVARRELRVSRHNFSKEKDNISGQYHYNLNDILLDFVVGVRTSGAIHFGMENGFYFSTGMGSISHERVSSTNNAEEQNSDQQVENAIRKTEMFGLHLLRIYLGFDL